jgi:hypothetical protein
MVMLVFPGGIERTKEEYTFLLKQAGFQLSFITPTASVISAWKASQYEIYPVQVVGDAAYELGVEHGQFTLVGQSVTINCRVTNVIVENPELGRLSITTLTLRSQ